MDEHIYSLKVELGKTARKIHGIYEDITYDEVADVKRQLQRLEVEIADIFKRHLGIVPHRVISNLTEQTVLLMSKEVEASRISERNENITGRLGKANQAISVKEMGNGLKDFIEQGVYEERVFEAKTDEILDRVCVAYRKVLEQSPSRGTDMAYEDIRSRCKNAFNRLQDNHNEYSRAIKKQVLIELEKMGLFLSSVECQMADEKVEKQMPCFAEQLGENVVSDDTLTQNDALEISSKEAKLKDSQEHLTTRKDLEALFK